MNHACTCKCSQENPTAVLKAEHRVIERVLDAAEQVLTEPALDREFLLKVVDFVRNFADGCHHAKEEDELFPELERRGVPREDGPIGCMLNEHEIGRALMRTITDNLDAAASGSAEAEKQVRSAARRYIDMLRMHIWKEDQVLFEMADRILGKEDRAAMMRAFDRAEHAEGRDGRHEHYVKLADELYQRAFGPAPCAAPV